MGHLFGQHESSPAGGGHHASSKVLENSKVGSKMQVFCWFPYAPGSCMVERQAARLTTCSSTCSPGLKHTLITTTYMCQCMVCMGMDSSSFYLGQDLEMNLWHHATSSACWLFHSLSLTRPNEQMTLDGITYPCSLHYWQEAYLMY